MRTEFHLFPFPASNDNEKQGPWAETNGPKTFCSELYDSGEKKFSIVHGDSINSWMETPIFGLAYHHVISRTYF